MSHSTCYLLVLGGVPPDTAENPRERSTMNDLPIVAIVGRRNVGKSTLFNALIRRKMAIVDPVPGLTRDVVSFNATHNSVVFTLADTPGLDLPDSSELSAPILENARSYLKRASVILLLMEPPAPTAFDMDLAEVVRRMAVPVIVTVNKMDGPGELEEMSNFYGTGFREVAPVSAKTYYNVGMLMDKIVEILPRKKTALREPDLKIAVVGRPNSGKSTLLNALIGYDRAVVSDVPGTTRDSVDEDFMYRKKKIRVIDTAGMRRKRNISEDVEYYSLTRTIDSIRRSDVAVHLIDAPAGLTETDKKISDEIMKEHKPTIIAINKWDLVEKDHRTFDTFTDRLTFRFYKAGDFPIISISAKNRQRVHRIVDTALELKERASLKVDTPRLNRIIAGIVRSHRIPQMQGRIKIYYATQTGSVPPCFRLFVNNPAHFRKDIIRHLEKTIQKELDLKGVPIMIQIEGKKRRGE